MMISRHKILTAITITGLFLIALTTVHALESDNDSGFDTGGAAPTHSWTDDEEPNTHTKVFEQNGTPVSPLEKQANPPGVYADTNCEDDELDPRLSVCELQEMARQIHATVENYVGAFMLMTQQFTATMMHQAFGIGIFMDADMKTDTDREIQTLMARAHKDYHPSEQMCRIGTFMRSVADTEQRMDFNKKAINAILMDTYLGKNETITAFGYPNDMQSRIDAFKNTYCDTQTSNEGLELFCKDANNNKERFNNDVDYQRIIESPLTLEVDFTEGTVAEDTEKDIIALARNLYWPKAMKRQPGDDLERKGSKYIQYRNLIAINSVAHASFAEIVAMKSRAAKVEEDKENEQGWHYMKQLLNELGISTTDSGTDNKSDADRLLGEYPSYYAQMEMLTKKIYQDPDFYTNLYDKPQNVRRISASLDAIKLIQGRDRFEAALRREMLLSSLLEQGLDKHFQEIDGRLGN